jgi:iron(III) transport system ATP-binding protein
VELTCGGDKLFLTTHQVPDIGAGDHATFWVKPKALHVFDAAGQRLEAADRLLRPVKIH